MLKLVSKLLEVRTPGSDGFTNSWCNPIRLANTNTTFSLLICDLGVAEDTFNYYIYSIIVLCTVIWDTICLKKNLKNPSFSCLKLRVCWIGVLM